MSDTIRVTKAQKYNAAIALLEGKPAVAIPSKDGKAGVTMDAEYLCDFFRAELALLAKKNTTTSGNKKLTKQQEKNEQFKSFLLAHLRNNPDLLITATDAYELLRANYPAEVWSNQRAASLLNAMCDKYDKDTQELVSEGKLLRTEGKGKTKTTFQIKPEWHTPAEDDEDDIYYGGRDEEND